MVNSSPFCGTCPLSAAELYERPEIDASGFFQSYVATGLECDLRSQLQVGSLRDFERFARAAA